MEDDYKLVAALKSNDRSAFDSLFRKYAEKLYNFSLAISKERFVAEEIVQIVFLRVWEKRQSISEHHSFKSFLFTIAYHEIISWIRKEQSEHRKIHTFYATTSQITQETEIKIDFQNFEALTNLFIDKLPDRRREIFKLSRTQGLSNKEIAAQLNISVKTVENQMTEALRFLKKNLTKETLLGVLFFIIYF